MTAGTILAAVAIVGVVVCAVGWRRSAARVSHLERRVGSLEREVRDDVLPTLDRSRRESESAIVTAREAAAYVGIEEPPPRLAGEALTGPVVRAVAFGAGARLAIARFTTDVAPLGRTRRVVTTVARTRALTRKVR